MECEHYLSLGGSHGIYELMKQCIKDVQDGKLSVDYVRGNLSELQSGLKGEDGYKLVWDDSMIFPNLTSADKVRVSTTQAERGEILDRNGRVLAGKGTAWSKNDYKVYYDR